MQLAIVNMADQYTHYLQEALLWTFVSVTGLLFGMIGVNEESANADGSSHHENELRVLLPGIIP
jgi:hypothetical protein